MRLRLYIYFFQIPHKFFHSAQTTSARDVTEKFLLQNIHTCSNLTMATHPRVEVSGMDGVPEEMVAELKKEIARNVEATKLVKQREIEATNARDK